MCGHTHATVLITFDLKQLPGQAPGPGNKKNRESLGNITADFSLNVGPYWNGAKHLMVIVSCHVGLHRLKTRHINSRPSLCYFYQTFKPVQIKTCLADFFHGCVCPRKSRCEHSKCHIISFVSDKVISSHAVEPGRGTCLNGGLEVCLWESNMPEQDEFASG